jgi:mannobiose 2-epimerase
MNEMKSQNTHLHILEAYTNLMRVWDNRYLKKQQHSLIDIMLNQITNLQTHHLILFQDADWTPKSDHVSYGHDIEASWLIPEAAEVLGDHDLIAKVKPRALKMAQAVYEEGLDSDGAIFYESTPDGEVDTRKAWWPQVEAAVGFLNAYQMSRQEYFLDAALKSWDFIEEYLIDRHYGGWFYFANHDTAEHKDEPKVSFWKCPYHNSRACMELSTRLQTLLKIADL